MDLNPANQQLLGLYGKGYHFLNETNNAFGHDTDTSTE